MMGLSIVSILHSRLQLARPQYGEADMSTDRKQRNIQLWTVANSKMYLSHLKTISV